MLEKIAEQMLFEAETTGSASRTLSRGLKMHLAAAGEGFVLILSRRDVAPSETELEVCLRAFKVGHDAVRANGDKRIILAW